MFAIARKEPISLTPGGKKALGGMAAGMLTLSLIIAPMFVGHSCGSSPRNACINNLRQIDAAKDEFSLEYGGDIGTNITWDQVAMYVKDITNKCYCPAAKKNNRYFSSNYRINPLGSDPECLVQPGTTDSPDHALRYKS